MVGKFNLALLFHNDVAESLVHYSKYINEQLPSDFTLSRDSLPHLTILQFELECEHLDDYWKRLGVSCVNSIMVDFSGLTFLPAKDGSMWIEAAILRNSSLSELHKIAVSQIDTGLITSNTLDSYRPHVSFAHSIHGSQIEHMVVDYRTVRQKAVECFLAVGESGPNYQFTRATRCERTVGMFGTL